MKQCPICYAEIEGNNNRPSVCSVCDTDLAVIEEMDQLPQILSKKADAAMEQDDVKKALDCYRSALALAPENEALLRKAAEITDAGGDAQKTVQAWRDLLLVCPEDQTALEQIAKLEKPETSGRRNYWVIPGIILLSLLVGWYGNGLRIKSMTPSKTDPILLSSTGVVNKTLLPAEGTRSSEGGVATSTRAQDRVHSEEPQVKAASEPARSEVSVQKAPTGLPKGVKVEVFNGGVLITGHVAYPWDRQALSEKLVQGGTWAFVDVTRVRVKNPGALRYTIKSGDSLSKVAQFFQGNTEYWSVLFKENQSTLSNPEKLYPGQVIIIP